MRMLSAGPCQKTNKTLSKATGCSTVYEQLSNSFQNGVCCGLAGGSPLITHRRKHPPESECFICGGGTYKRTIWTLRESQQPTFVPFQITNFDKRRILPKRQLVPGISMSCQKFSLLLPPDNPSDLALCMRRHQHAAARSIPEADLPICRASTSRQNMALPWTPPNGFHRSLVLCEGVQRRARARGLPNANQVVITS
mmetsp:Transcript_97415/g.135403  ORF Transcript_97415/g.135403 Transcript_97415/m.135403 type:complete len:197 (-) Transcript_97415:749-1339(-)